MATKSGIALRGGVFPSQPSYALRLGILTYHACINYGAVLQALALQQTLRGLGYDVQVLDVWISPSNHSLLGLFSVGARWPRLRTLLSTLLGCGRGSDSVRRIRTFRFLRKYLNRSPFHFFDWAEVPVQQLAVDCVVVGSDQVWNPTISNPRACLLEHAPEHLKAISYAASFGVVNLEGEWPAFFKKQLKRFSAISVRESQGVHIVENLGFQATHVLDPTQLLPAKTWRTLLNLPASPKQSRRPTLVCYFMTSFLADDFLEKLPALRNFARRMKCDVEVFLEFGAFALPRGLGELRALFRQRLRYAWLSKGIKVRRAAGPWEFVEAIARATWVVTGSFHGMMFSSLFNKDLRFLKPKSEARLKIFSRVESFAKKYANGPLIADSIEAALDSLARGERVTFDEAALAADRTRSLEWLRNALTAIEQA